MRDLSITEEELDFLQEEVESLLTSSHICLMDNPAGSEDDLLDCPPEHFDLPADLTAKAQALLKKIREVRAAPRGWTVGELREALEPINPDITATLATDAGEIDFKVGVMLELLKGRDPEEEATLEGDPPCPITGLRFRGEPERGWFEELGDENKTVKPKGEQDGES